MSEEGTQINQPARNVVPMPEKKRFLFTEYGILRNSDIGYRISDHCRISDTGFPPAPAYSARDTLPRDLRVFFVYGMRNCYGIRIYIGYIGSLSDIGHRLAPGPC